MKVVALVPIKTNNERLPGKNTCDLGGRPMIAHILQTLQAVSGINAVFVYCSDSSIRAHLPATVTFLSRPKALDSSDTSISEVLASFSKAVVADVYLLAHATAPFLKKESIQRGLDSVLSTQFDSALSVVQLKEFFWLDGKPFNYKVTNIPKTQDLAPIYKETSGFYIFEAQLISKHNRRVGYKPYLCEVNDVEAVDINNPIDLFIARSIVENPEKHLYL